MNAHVKIEKPTPDLAQCGHWLQELPYRAVIAVATQPQHGTILYQVAGEAHPPQSAFKALKLALSKHGGKCFYCKSADADTPTEMELTIDHIEPVAIGGGNELTNLVVACKPCNQEKGMQRIDAFNPIATEEWLLALARQIETRFERLKANSPIHPD